MGFFTRRTKTVDLGGGNNAVMRGLDFDEHQQAISKASHTDKDGAVVVDYPRLRAEVGKLALVSWEGPDFEGREATPGNFAQLSPTIGGKLADAALELLTITATEGE